MNLPIRNEIFFLFLVLLAAILFFSSCNKGDVYYRFQQVENGKWNKDNALSFTLDSLPFVPNQPYDISLEITNNNLYPYQNIWLLVEHNLRDSLMQRDTLEIKLTNRHDKWLGNGVGGLHQLSASYIDAIQLDSAKQYRIRVKQVMENQTLNGIEKVGFKIVNANSVSRQ